MGKSLYGAGGQNPLEAIRAGSVVVSGLNLANFQEIYDVIKDVSYRVADENALYDCLFSLLSDPDLCALRAREAKLAIAPFEGAVQRTYQAIQGYLT
jgi:3-deoxy-D-manno-octulosonic-acid transferase